jgi:acid phosphatase family membrane protein YuiD
MSERVQNYVNMFTGNHALNVAILCWFTAQVLKVVLTLITKRKLDWGRILGSGGMPSSHAALVCGLAASLGKTVGVSSPSFALACVLAFVVMYDAFNVRRAAGDQAKVLNFMLKNWDKTTPEMLGRELKELLGHTPLQVLMGAILGIAFGVWL